jgi:hypothetical protein
MFKNCLGITTVAFRLYHFGPKHPGYTCSASGHVILAGITTCTDSITSLSIHVGIMGRHIGESPYDNHSATNGIRYHMMSATPFSPTHPMTVATNRYNAYERTRLMNIRLRGMGQRLISFYRTRGVLPVVSTAEHN